MKKLLPILAVLIVLLILFILPLKNSDFFKGAISKFRSDSTIDQEKLKYKKIKDIEKVRSGIIDLDNIVRIREPLNFDVLPPVCGNNIVETGEVCDGERQCNSACSAFDAFPISLNTSGEIPICLPAGLTGGIVHFDQTDTCRLILGESNYIITLSNFVENRPVFAIRNTSLPVEEIVSPPLLSGLGGFFTVDNLFTLRQVDESLREFSETGVNISLHKITAPKTIIPFYSNCNRISNSAARLECEQLLIKIRKKFIPAMESVTGNSYGRCYQSIRFVFDNSDEFRGFAGMYGLEGRVFLSKALLTSILNLPEDRKIEDHEILHLNDICLNLPIGPEMHAFWYPRLILALEAANMPVLANLYESWLAEILDRSNNDDLIRSDLEYPSENYRGCSGIKDLLLIERFLSDRTIINSYYSALIRNQARLSSDVEGNNLQTYNNLVAEILGNGTSVRDRINLFCTSHPVE